MFDYLPILITGLVAIIIMIAIFRASHCVRYIPNNRVGVKEKLWDPKKVLRSGLIALDGEPGYQPELLRGGFHFFVPFQYRVHIVPLVTISQGTIGYVFARDGAPLHSGQALGGQVSPAHFLDVRAFLAAGGQRGPQRQVLREGTYAINLAQFVVQTADHMYLLSLGSDEASALSEMSAVITERDGFTPVVISGKNDMIGVVTVNDGPSLPQDEIIAPVVGDRAEDERTWHNGFQDAEKFLAAGGRRGRQMQVLVEGTFYINRLFATVEYIAKTVVEVGTVGVVVSYIGDKGADLSGVDYSHGEMVENGKRGVWSTALLPGKYAFNTYAGKIVMVPTTNIILKWISGQTGSHRLDENLSEIQLITKDAFEPSLPLSVVVHIDYRQAPLVVQRFGDIRRLVEQTLDPMVSAYFKNIGQTRTLIQLIQDRSAIQQHAGSEMKAKFARYNLELEEVLLGTPGSTKGDGAIERILTQLRDRQVAEEQIETYSRQEKAAVKERELREAEARSRVQAKITESELSISIQSNEGKAQFQRSLQQAQQIRTLAEAEADKVRLIGQGEASKVKAMAEAEGERVARVGLANALAVEEQVRAYGGPQLQLTQQVMLRFAEAIEHSKVEVVPRILIQGGANGGTGGTGGMGGGNGGSLFEALLGMLMSDRLAATGTNAAPASAEMTAYADKLRREMMGSLQAGKEPAKG